MCLQSWRRRWSWIKRWTQKLKAIKERFDLFNMFLSSHLNFRSALFLSSSPAGIECWKRTWRVDPHRWTWATQETHQNIKTTRLKRVHELYKRLKPFKLKVKPSCCPTRCTNIHGLLLWKNQILLGSINRDVKSVHLLQYRMFLGVFFRICNFTNNFLKSKHTSLTI